ncbi:hypothetical protein GCM10010358_55450 [Streptomyces minutiscleroticus]|uniref:Uncharacterized protein n=1 Tax=Streptomyces minutiscleroticus TaxID=68238 RepID=A0A918U4V1_9ACTN|nr:hypothetical protein [Streptomyces minutiscleroticus]GGX94480.1 hypothetical protein GCM10010358_55450 [Streptomyces minutiscleroticus]
MKRIAEVLGFLALVQGLIGLSHALFGWPRGWGLVQRLAVLDGYEVYASGGLLVLACALFAAADRLRPG